MKFFTPRMLISTISCALLLASSVSAHSWVWCTDYQVQEPGAELQGPDETDPARRNFDSDLCSGWPPNVPTFFDAKDNDNFGTDSGAENRPQLRQEFCVQSGGNSYSADFPMASYVAGEIVTLVYPAKNHVAASNLFIPDNGVNIYMAPLESRPLDNGFPSASDYLDSSDNLLFNFNGEHQNGVADFLGFQNCPEFPTADARGQDRATCTMDFQLPADLAAGEYFFGWHWEFNGGEHYTTCFSAVVAAADGVTATTTEATTTVTTTQATTTTQETEPVETVAGVECAIAGIAACTKGLDPARGTCVVTDENDLENGFICVCEEGFVDTSDAQTCLLEDGVRILIVLNVQFDSIANEAVFELALEQDLVARFDIDIERLSFTFQEGEGVDDGLVVAILTVAGASDENELSAQSFFDELSSTDTHDFGVMSNSLSITCLDCSDDDTTGASAALAPSLALIVAAAASSLIQ